VAKLGKEAIVTLHHLHSKNISNAEIARKLEVSEGAVRHHLKRKAQSAIDGRKKRSLIEKHGLVEAVDHWWQNEQQGLKENRPPSVKMLHEYLVEEHDFGGSYKAVRKFVRGRYEAPKRRPRRRIETPPGVQTQTDWFQVDGIDIGLEEGPVTLYGFVMILSHSRKAAVVWSRSMDQLAWQHCHNEAFTRLGGIAAVNRIDNLKTGVAKGAGPWAQINECYKGYVRTMGFHVDAHEAGCPEQKGKVERAVRYIKSFGLADRVYENLEQLQAWTDKQVEAFDRRRICPPTGKTVLETWEAERKLLRPLPARMPKPFNLIQHKPVHKDCTINFEGRQYAAPFEYVGREVEVRGCSGIVEIRDPKTGTLLQMYPRHTQSRILIDPACYEGEATERVVPPKPLGRMARKIQEIEAMGLEQRSVNWYAELAEVAP